MKFRKKPVVIDAVRWMTDNYETVSSFVGDSLHPGRDGSTLYINTLEGVMTARPFDWIIKGAKGEFYPCKPDIFEATYEAFPEVREPFIGELQADAWGMEGKP